MYDIHDIINGLKTLHGTSLSCFILVGNYFQINGVGVFNHPHSLEPPGINKSIKVPGANKVNPEGINQKVFLYTLIKILGKSRAHKLKQNQLFPQHTKIRSRNAHPKLLKSKCVCSASARVIHPKSNKK